MSDADPAAQAAMAVLGRYVIAFRAEATQLRTYQIGGRWWRLSNALQREQGRPIPPTEAAAWANLGYLPEEAAPQVRSGITAATARDMEDHAAQQVGGPEALAATRIAELLAQDGWYGPDEAVSVQDPTDPAREIVMLREDLDEA